MGFQEFLGKFSMLAFCPVGASFPLVIHSLENSLLLYFLAVLWQLLKVSSKSSPYVHVCPLFQTYFHAGICMAIIPQGKLFLHGFLEMAVVVITVVLYFCLVWPWKYLLCTHPCPLLLFSVTGNPLTACPTQSSGSSLLPLLQQYLAPHCHFLIRSVSFPTIAGFKSLFAVGDRESTYGVPGDAVLAAAHAFC